MFREAIDALSFVLEGFDGCRVIYTRSPSEIETVTATRGKTEIEEVDESGVVTKSQSVDWFIKTISLPFGLPQRGDTIELDEREPGNTTKEEVRYEVMPIGDELYRFCDHTQRRMRIHTKRVSRA